jgi:hypothetical protein
VQVRVGTAQVQPAPESAVIVRPAGGVSVTVTVPLDGELPTFNTVTKYVNVCPGTTVFGLCVFAIVRSIPAAGAAMIVGSESVLLVEFMSLPPDTTAVFVTVPGAALALTLVVTVMSG